MEEKMTYFTADWHIGHARIIEYCNRPFKNVSEMDVAILDMFQKAVKPGDTLYYLGDLAFGKDSVLKTLEIIKNAGVTLHYIVGNHDKKYKHLIKPYCETFRDVVELQVGNTFMILYHYGIEDWNGAFHGSIHLHGHSHNMLKHIKNRRDTGIDATGFKLLPLSQVLQIHD